MEVIIHPDRQSGSILAAKIIAKLMRNKSDAVLGLATGLTPIPLFRELIRLHQEEGLDFSRVTTFNLDEYLGLHPEHPASYHRFMREHLFSHVNIPPDRIYIPDGLTNDVPGHCADYEKRIRYAGGIDLQILGLVSDGLLGFNEPGSSLASRTRVKTLTQRTRSDNARFFTEGEEVPHHVITMGLGTIMESRMCVLLAFGKAKVAAVSASVEGPVTASVPGSLLQFHPQAKALLDTESASQLNRLDYYRWVYANKPEWQKF